MGIVLVGIIATTSGWFMLKDYQKDRLVNFVSPDNDPKGTGYNVIQSIIAVGSGGIWGKGLGHGSQSQLNFLPEKHTDFIFAVFSEELGFFGSGVVLGLFGLLIYRVKETARLARDNFGYLLAIGVIVMIFSQVLVNVGMNIGVAPVAGVPLPFLSYGGSSMVSVLASIGVIQSVYIRRIKAI
jgi:rod shape determining protein RodA